MSDQPEYVPVRHHEVSVAGSGEQMRIAPVGWYSFTSGGGRFVVRTDPQAAMQIAVAQLQAVGFALGDGTFQRLLHESGSEWLAQDLRLGEIKRSWKRGVVAWLVEDTGLEFFRPFWRGATPTLVVASARATPAGTELVIYPHGSILGGSDANDAGPLIRTTLAALNDHFSKTGTLVSAERMRGIKNDGSPASQAVVRDLLGWR
ncbi:hypothetical protein NQ156_07430 [Microbacterium sp. zg.Y625]|uniref:hypothetical protein n=1 Tax=Microbacterium jiangjiandongii TaxID=3049071 RepID=UPI00214B5F0F|nr:MULTISPECIES: hypothetical protein [unclassified Microbacterium]MCR2792891.1 hypothetical protein [Microbacterium sp. zg.Y625]WIM24014.1 hypothetical protein QNO14_07455 [Microbacterium sp. zg-Y625]